MEEIDYKKGLIYVFTRWAYIVIGVFFAVVIAITVLPVLHKTTYVASIDVALAAVEGTNLDENLKQNAQLIYNYNSLIKNDALIAEIIEKNGYDYSISQLKGMIETEIFEDTTIVNISVKNSDKELAIQILNDIIDKLREETQNIYFIDNVHAIKNILVEKTENFKMSIMMFAFMAGGAILTIGIISLIGYFRKVIMLDKSENQLLGLDVIARIKRKELKEFGNSETFSSIYLYIKRKSSKIIGIMEDKKCIVSENLVIDIAKNINNKKVLILKCEEKTKSQISIFLENEEYYKKKKQLKFKAITKGLENEESLVELYTSKNNNIDILKFNSKNSLVALTCDENNLEGLQKLFEEYDYIFISMDNKIDNSGTKVLGELCDTVFIIVKNYITKEEEIGQIKNFCAEEKIKNNGIIAI